MIFVVALFVWFALSVPAALLVGHILGAGTRHSHVPVRARRMATSGHSRLSR